MKKAISIIIAVMTVICCASVLCEADDAGEIKNFKVDEYGNITWDDYGGYDSYWLQVDIYSTPIDHGADLKTYIDGPGEYPLCLFLCDDDGKTVAQSKMYIKYDGNKFYKIEKLSETEPPTETEPKPENTVDYGDGVIKNVALTKDGILTWDPYDKAEDYWLGVDGGFTPAESGVDLKYRISEPGTYRLDVEAYAEEGEKFIAAWFSMIVYDGTVFRFVSEQPEQTTANETTAETKEDTAEDTTEQTAQQTTTETAKQTTKEETDTTSAETETEITTDIPTETESGAALTDDTTKEQDNDGNNRTKWIIAGVCILVTAAALTGVLLISKKNGKEK